MIPREIDDLMWTIAEGTDQSAIEEFGDRYPAFREELLKRIRTVKALKSGSRTQKTSVPTFQNTKVQPANRTMIWASLAFAAVAVFSFGVYKISSRTNVPAPITPVNTQPAQIPDANVTMNPVGGATPIMVPQPKHQNQPYQAPDYNSPSQNQPPITSSPKSFKIEATPLQSVILMIAEAGHINATIAPGMPNPTVNVDYQNMEPMEMLRQLGEEYAFTTVNDGPRAIIVIPKKDEEEGQISANH